MMCSCALDIFQYIQYINKIHYKKVLKNVKNHFSCFHDYKSDSSIKLQNSSTKPEYDHTLILF